MVNIIILLAAMPAIAVLIFGIIYPKKSFSFGRRWQYENADLEPSENAIKYTRIVSIIGLILLGMIIIFS